MLLSLSYAVCVEAVFSSSQDTGQLECVLTCRVSAEAQARTISSVYRETYLNNERQYMLYEESRRSAHLVAPSAVKQWPPFSNQEAEELRSRLLQQGGQHVLPPDLLSYGYRDIQPAFIRSFVQVCLLQPADVGSFQLSTCSACPLSCLR